MWSGYYNRSNRRSYPLNCFVSSADCSSRFFYWIYVSDSINLCICTASFLWKWFTHLFKHQHSRKKQIQLQHWPFLRFSRFNFHETFNTTKLLHEKFYYLLRLDYIDKFLITPLYFTEINNTEGCSIDRR